MKKAFLISLSVFALACNNVTTEGEVSVEVSNDSTSVDSVVTEAVQVDSVAPVDSVSTDSVVAE
jgi:hypothetical protein